jgi:hypothetical protein
MSRHDHSLDICLISVESAMHDAGKQKEEDDRVYGSIGVIQALLQRLGQSCQLTALQRAQMLEIERLWDVTLFPDQNKKPTA